MTRSELEHIIRAAGAIANDTDIFVVGSQSVLGQFPRAPTALLASMEADVYPLHAPDRADLIDGSIGEGSAFHESFGYYAQGVGPRTATLPYRWRRRLVRVKNDNTRGATGLCLEVNGLAISKYVAGREKDLEFTAALAQHAMTSKAAHLARLAKTRFAAGIRPLVRARILRDFSMD
jgi:hypothetical protein